MNPTPPHLPPHTVSVSLHNLFTRTRSFLVFVFISVLAGITGSLIVSAWVEPHFYDTANTLVYRSEQNLISANLPDPFVLQRYNQATLSLFSADAEVEKGWYTQDGYAGKLVMLTSDGWGVAYVPAMSSAQKQQLHVRDHDGNIFEIEKVRYDNINDISYIKVRGENFYVLPFAVWDDIDIGSTMWGVHNDTWQQTSIATKNTIESTLHPMTTQVAYMRIEPDQPYVRILISPQGHFIGFADAENNVRSAWSVSDQISSLLTEGDLTLPSITTTGYFVTTQTIYNEQRKTQQGFYIVNPGSVSEFEVGDIVYAWNGIDVTLDTLHQLVYRVDANTRVSVWRGGEKFDILLEN